jgi:serine/threonine protein kinase
MFDGRDVGGFVLVKQISVGQFSQVWIAEHAQTRLRLAVKVIAKSRLVCEEVTTLFIRELNLLRQMDHPFIAKVFDVIEDDDYYYMLIELAEHGSLCGHVHNLGVLAEVRARRYFVQLLLALEYLHTERGVVHRGLRLENVMLDRNDNIKLIDFGLSTTFAPTSRLLRRCPPEVKAGAKYSVSSDIWSAGIVLASLVTGRLPLDDCGVRELVTDVMHPNPILGSRLSAPLVDLLAHIVQEVPEDRISLDAMKMHKWVAVGDIHRFLCFRFGTQEQWMAATSHPSQPDPVVPADNSGVVQEIARTRAMSDRIARMMNGFRQPPATVRVRLADLATVSHSTPAHTAPVVRVQVMGKPKPPVRHFAPAVRSDRSKKVPSSTSTPPTRPDVLVRRPRASQPSIQQRHAAPEQNPT